MNKIEVKDEFRRHNRAWKSGYVSSYAPVANKNTKIIGIVERETGVIYWENGTMNNVDLDESMELEGNYIELYLDCKEQKLFEVSYTEKYTMREIMDWNFLSYSDKCQINLLLEDMSLWMGKMYIKRIR